MACAPLWTGLDTSLMRAVPSAARLLHTAAHDPCSFDDPRVGRSNPWGSTGARTPAPHRAPRQLLAWAGGDVEPNGPGSGGAGGQGASVSSSSGSPPAASSSSGGVVSSSSTGGAGPTDDILEYLADLPGVTVDEQDSGHPDDRFFVLTIEQPADHTDPGGPVFQQRLFAPAHQQSAPVRARTTGYGFGGSLPRRAGAAARRQPAHGGAPLLHHLASPTPPTGRS